MYFWVGDKVHMIHMMQMVVSKQPPRNCTDNERNVDNAGCDMCNV